MKKLETLCILPTLLLSIPLLALAFVIVQAVALFRWMTYWPHRD